MSGCLGLLLLAACSRTESTEKASPAPAAIPVSAPAAPKSAEPAKPSIEDTTFKLALSGQPEYAVGKAGVVELTLEARGGYHVNQDYPIRIDLKAPAAIKLEKAAFEKADAKQFGEERARFELPFSAQQGVHELSAVVDFAVCTKETCVPDQRTVALALNVR